MKQMNELRWTGVGGCEELFAESPVWLEAELVWNFIPGLAVLCVFPESHGSEFGSCTVSIKDFQVLPKQISESLLAKNVP